MLEILLNVGLERTTYFTCKCICYNACTNTFIVWFNLCFILMNPLHITDMYSHVVGFSAIIIKKSTQESLSEGEKNIICDMTLFSLKYNLIIFAFNDLASSYSALSVELRDTPTTLLIMCLNQFVKPTDWAKLTKSIASKTSSPFRQVFSEVNNRTTSQFTIYKKGFDAFDDSWINTYKEKFGCRETRTDTNITTWFPWLVVFHMMPSTLLADWCVLRLYFRRGPHYDERRWISVWLDRWNGPSCSSPTVNELNATESNYLSSSTNGGLFNCFDNLKLKNTR